MSVAASTCLPATRRVKACHPNRKGILRPSLSGSRAPPDPLLERNGRLQHEFRATRHHGSPIHGDESRRAEDHHAHRLRLCHGRTGRCGRHRGHSGRRQPIDGRAGPCQHAAGDVGGDDLSRRDGRPCGASCLAGRRYAVSQFSLGRLSGDRKCRTDPQGDPLPGREAGRRRGAGRSDCGHGLRGHTGDGPLRIVSAERSSTGRLSRAAR